MKKRVLVVGGYGILGAQVSRALAQDPEIDVVVAGRRPKLGVPFAQSIGASFLPLDVHDTASLKAALPGTFALVHAAGPFTEGPYDVARACIEAGPRAATPWRWCPGRARCRRCPRPWSSC
jgi:saccharopine dehydrogenase-like NADP-dependent oxidoreductase